MTRYQDGLYVVDGHEPVEELSTITLAHMIREGRLSQNPSVPSSSRVIFLIFFSAGPFFLHRTVSFVLLASSGQIVQDKIKFMVTLVIASLCILRERADNRKWQAGVQHKLNMLL